MPTNHRTTGCAIDLAMRHTAVLFWADDGFEWEVFSTNGPRGKESRESFETTYHAQECAEELYDWLRDTVLARMDLALVAVELATHAQSSGALCAMMLARGAFAAIAPSLRRRQVAVDYVVQQESRAAVLAVRPKSVRIRKDATEEEQLAARRQREENRAEIKRAVKLHVLFHFPELASVEASVGHLAEHVYDAASVLIATAPRPSAGLLGDERRARLLDASVPTARQRAVPPLFAHSVGE